MKKLISPIAMIIAFILSQPPLVNACDVEPTPLYPDFCRQLDESGTINVMCPWDDTLGDYAVGGTYANPNDECDDTAAIQSALDRAVNLKTVLLPTGENSQVGSLLTNPYRVSSPLNVSYRRLVGGSYHTNGDRTAARILFVGPHSEGPANTLPPPKWDAGYGAPYIAASVLYSSNARCQIENLIVNGNNLVGYGIYLFKANFTSINNVLVTGTLEAGFFTDSAQMFSFDLVRAELNAKDGIVMVAGNGSSVIKPTACYNGRHGIVVTRRNGNAYEGGSSGGLALLHGDAEGNGTNAAEGEGNGVYVINTTTPVLVTKFWLEENYWDGFRAEKAHNVSLLYSNVSGVSQGAYAEGESKNHAFHLIDCKHCTIKGNTVATYKDYENGWYNVWIEGLSTFPIVTENIYDSGFYPTEYLGGGMHFEVVYDDGNTKQRMGQHFNGAMQCESQPTTGTWRVGDICWNRSPASGEPAGWMCSQPDVTQYPYGCAEWLKIGMLTQ